MGDTPVFAVDAFLSGDRLRRGVDLVVDDARVTFDGVELALADVFCMSRRSGLLLVFSRSHSVAFSASTERLDELEEELSRLISGDSLRKALVDPLGEEVVCLAGAAVSGAVDGSAVRGLFASVFTEDALHLFEQETHLRVPWPMGAREVTDPARPSQPVLVLQDENSSLRVLYLFPEEIRAICGAAERAPVPPSDGADESQEAIEMFARREVAGPTPARLPEFATSKGTIRTHAEKVAGEVPTDLRLRALLETEFFADHFTELGETALGPLLFRKSAAGRARSLAKAVEAMDAGALQDDARAAAINSLRRLTDAYERELKRALRGKRKAQKLDAELAVSEAVRESLQGRFLAPVHDLAPQLHRLEGAQADLLVRLERLEEGPPEGEEAQLDEAAGEWHGALIAVDRSFDTAWQELLSEIGVVWSETLLPQLAEAAAAPRQRVPEWLKLVAIGLITTLAVATAVLVFRGLS
jgi:hypothetical protein